MRKIFYGTDKKFLQLGQIKLFESDASNDYQQTPEWQGLARKTDPILKVCLLKVPTMLQDVPLYLFYNPV